MYIWSTNLQGPHSIPQFPVVLNEALPFYLMSGVQHCQLHVILYFQFLVCILMKENMSKM